MSEADDLDPSHLGPRADLASAKAMVDALDADAMKGLLDKMAALRASALARGADAPDAEAKNAMAQEMFETMRVAMLEKEAGPDGRRVAVVVACAFVIFMLLAFFGYKLYRSLVDKERKREEKKKLKQQKKRK